MYQTQFVVCLDLFEYILSFCVVFYDFHSVQAFEMITHRMIYSDDVIQFGNKRESTKMELTWAIIRWIDRAFDVCKTQNNG